MTYASHNEQMSLRTRLLLDKKVYIFALISNLKIVKPAVRCFSLVSGTKRTTLGQSTLKSLWQLAVACRSHSTVAFTSPLDTPAALFQQFWYEVFNFVIEYMQNSRVAGNVTTANGSTRMKITHSHRVTCRSVSPSSPFAGSTASKSSAPSQMAKFCSMSIVVTALYRTSCYTEIP